MQDVMENMRQLRENPYPGRGIVVGLHPSGMSLIQIYWIMGRSANSRNRIFEVDSGGTLRTVAADPSKVQDASLIIYNVMRELNGLYVVTNGDQTDTIVQSQFVGVGFMKALNTRVYEPDKPNYTPRISAICLLREAPVIEISLLKRSAFGMGCDRQLFRYESLKPGFGFYVATYQGDGNPLPSWEGEPRIMPISCSTPSDIAKFYWDALNEDNRVAIAVKFIPLDGGKSAVEIINKYEKV